MQSGRVIEGDKFCKSDSQEPMKQLPVSCTWYYMGKISSPLSQMTLRALWRHYLIPCKWYKIAAVFNFLLIFQLRLMWHFQKYRVRHLYIYYRTYSIQWCYRKNHKKFIWGVKNSQSWLCNPVPRRNACYQMENSISVLTHKTHGYSLWKNILLPKC
jgi:hypothetical protein